MHLEGDGEVKQEGELVVDDDQITVRDKETAALSPMDQSNGEQKQSGCRQMAGLWHRRRVRRAGDPSLWQSPMGYIFSTPNWYAPRPHGIAAARMHRFTH